MQHEAHSVYLETEVLTATRQKLRLMLIDGAIRTASQVREHWRNDRDDEAFEALEKCRAIIAELLAAIKADEFEPASRVASVYVYLLGALTEANRTRDAGKLSDVIEILQVERETWQQVCRETPAALAGHGSRHQAAEVTASSSRSIPITDSSMGGIRSDAAPQQGQISFEA